VDKHARGIAPTIDRSLEVEIPERNVSVPELISLSRPESRLDTKILLWNSRQVLLRVAFWGLIVSTIVAFAIPRRYTSTMSLMPPDQHSGVGTAMMAALAGKAGGGGGGGGELAALAGDVLGVKNSGDLFLGVLRSRTVQENLVRKFDLRKVYGDRLWEDACKDLEKHTDIVQDRKSGIIGISVTDHSPQRAAAMSAEYGAELNDVVNQLNTSSAHRERVFLEQRLTEVKQDLEQAERDFSQFSSKNSTLDIKEQGKAMVEAAAVLQGQLIAAGSQLQALRQIYTENNARVKATEAEVAELRAQLQKLGGVDASASSASDEDGSFYPSIKKLPLLGVPYADLYRRTKVDEVVFEVLTQQYEMAKVEEAKDTPTVKVLDSASLPEKRSFPPRLLIMFLGTVVALAGAALLSVAKARWHATDDRDPDKLFAQEVLQTMNARMPWSPPNGSRFQRFTHDCWTRLARRDDSGGRAQRRDN
jgi:uncharacterized protein involved in exopolysaccharide biosynthesis